MFAFERFSLKKNNIHEHLHKCINNAIIGDREITKNSYQGRISEANNASQRASLGGKTCLLQKFKETTVCTDQGLNQCSTCNKMKSNQYHYGVSQGPPIKREEWGASTGLHKETLCIGDPNLSSSSELPGSILKILIPNSATIQRRLK